MAASRFPRGCKAQLEQLIQEAHVTAHYSDERSTGNPIEMAFKGTLHPEQQIAADQMLEYEDGIMSAPTGFGKTVIGALPYCRHWSSNARHRSQDRAHNPMEIPARAICRHYGQQGARPNPKKDESAKKQPPLIGQIGGGKTAVKWPHRRRFISIAVWQRPPNRRANS